MKQTLVQLTLALSLAEFAFACSFSIYPGAERSTRHNARHGIAYSTPDAYEKVIEYYKKDCKVG